MPHFLMPENKSSQKTEARNFAWKDAKANWNDDPLDFPSENKFNLFLKLISSKSFNEQISPFLPRWHPDCTTLKYLRGLKVSLNENRKKRNGKFFYAIQVALRGENLFAKVLEKGLSVTVLQLLSENLSKPKKKELKTYKKNWRNFTRVVKQLPSATKLHKTQRFILILNFPSL